MDKDRKIIGYMDVAYEPCDANGRAVAASQPFAVD